MQKVQKGFTLVELIVVIVLLGILGVTALGKFQDLSANAADSANSGVASEMSSAAAINYAVSVTGGTPDVTINTATTVSVGNDCTTANFGGLYQSGAFPAGFTITESDSLGVAGNGNHACAAAGDTNYCSVQRSSAPTGTLAVAAVICTGP
ncbi:MAG: type II secretion system protein [Gammaproteobacteria bacterium]|nr:type II secretion system protein [Gammaproteobacteria bacterium]